MQSLGETLREVREARGFALEDVEKAIRIRARHLQAMEAGDFALLPSPTQARGFLRNYARFLGLDGDQMLARYDELARRRGRLSGFLRRRSSPRPDAGGAPRTAPRPATARRPAGWSPRARIGGWFSADLLVALLITLALLAVLVWGGARLADAVAVLGNATATTSAFLLSTATPAPVTPLAPAPGNGQPTAVSTPLPLAAFTNVQVQVLVEQRAYLRVSVDGEQAFAAMVAPGESHSFVAERVVELATGNGAGIHVFFNQRDQGVLGRFGEVVIRLWTLEGPLTPTPTTIPTPTRTPRPQ
ncbi:MAG: DUF4115 domain-containing protein [Chloroflexi bacterium]|nr:DUF4115 domain-containing protein [Chloroflexota bacterium]